ncbi:MAG: hypothetical protein AAF492_24065, partial [Verrucomicrobiota bacterium]
SGGPAATSGMMKIGCRARKRRTEKKTTLPSEKVGAVNMPGRRETEPYVCRFLWSGKRTAEKDENQSARFDDVTIYQVVSSSLRSVNEYAVGGLQILETKACLVRADRKMSSR